MSPRKSSEEGEPQKGTRQDEGITRDPNAPATNSPAADTAGTPVEKPEDDDDEE